MFMSNKKIVIVDYGLGNLYSLLKALKCFADNVVITDNPNTIIKADAVVIPGVGAFAVGMQGLKERGLIEPIRDFAASGKPMLGICLGAQLMLSKGYEFGEYEGLDIISGVVKIFPESVSGREKIPHIGWNEIYPTKESGWNNTIFSNVKNKASVYFVHSYIMAPDNIDDISVLVEYGGFEFCAATKKGNIYGTQFHPEKSGEVGLKIIKSFVDNIN